MNYNPDRNRKMNNFDILLIFSIPCKTAESLCSQSEMHFETDDRDNILKENIFLL